MKYYITYNADTSQFVVKYGYGFEEDVVHSEFFKRITAVNTALELNRRHK